MGEKKPLSVTQWSVYVPLAGHETTGHLLATGYSQDSLLGVVEALTRDGMAGPQQIRIEVIREP